MSRRHVTGWTLCDAHLLCTVGNMMNDDEFEPARLVALETARNSKMMLEVVGSRYSVAKVALSPGFEIYRRI